MIVTGESIFAIKMWDPSQFDLPTVRSPEFRVAVLELCGKQIEEELLSWLRQQRLGFTLKREEGGYRLEFAPQALRKKVIFEAFVKTDFARLTIGPRCRGLPIAPACVVRLET
ncbi:MAG: hypothetical protein ACUVWX_13365 [Kiritimatiellia bacterium]